MFAILVSANSYICVFCLCGGFENVQFYIVMDSNLPNLVHTCGCDIGVGFCIGGYEILLLVRISLRLGNLRKPISGFRVKICFSSSQLSMIFQLEYINFLMFGFVGLYLVIITGGVLDLFFRFICK